MVKYYSRELRVALGAAVWGLRAVSLALLLGGVPNPLAGLAQLLAGPAGTAGLSKGAVAVLRQVGENASEDALTEAMDGALAALEGVRTADNPAAARAGAGVSAGVLGGEESVLPPRPPDQPSTSTSLPPRSRDDTEGSAVAVAAAATAGEVIERFEGGELDDESQQQKQLEEVRRRRRRGLHRTARESSRFLFCRPWRATRVRRCGWAWWTSGTCARCGCC